MYIATLINPLNGEEKSLDFRSRDEACEWILAEKGKAKREGKEMPKIKTITRI